MNAEDKERSGSSRPLPNWANDWVPLRAVDTPQLGLPKFNVMIYVPATVGHIANAARVKLEYRNSEVDEAKLRDKALLPRVEAEEPPDPVKTAHKSADASVAIPVAVVLDPAIPINAPKSPKRIKRPAGMRVKVMAEGVLQRYAYEIELLGKRKTKDDAKADREMAVELLKRGDDRTVVLHRAWRERLRRLAEDMPNFAEVIQHVHTCCALAQMTRRPLRITPILLVGMPGLGKTFFAARLAEVLGVPKYVFALENAETMSTLLGSDKHWANTEPGQLFRHIVLGEIANPVFVLDELDKAAKGSGGSSGYQAAMTLHGPLEPLTAKALRDKSADLCFDASHVIYIATANRLSSIDGSLLSRFKLILIKQPDVRTSLAIARSVARSVLDAFGIERKFKAITGEALQQLALLGSPRTQQRALQAAIGRAICDGRWELRVQDLSTPSDAGKTSLGLGAGLH